MGLDVDVIQRIREWIFADRASLLSTDLDSTFRYEDGTFRVIPPDSTDWILGRGEGLVDVALIAEAIAADSICLVARGRDPVTNMWHQCAWVFEFRAQKIIRLVKTVTGGLPVLHYDGTLPLRSVGG